MPSDETCHFQSVRYKDQPPPERRYLYNDKSEIHDWSYLHSAGNLPHKSRKDCQDLSEQNRILPSQIRLPKASFAVPLCYNTVRKMYHWHFHKLFYSLLFHQNFDPCKDLCHHKSISIQIGCLPLTKDVRLLLTAFCMPSKTVPDHSFFPDQHLILCNHTACHHLCQA